MNSDYSILGLQQGASQAEIKKAYFGMVRLHSPESDPEKFQEIRQAYERLKNAGNRPDGPVFPSLSDPNAVKMLRQIQIYRKEKNLTLYRDACEEAWSRFPDDLQFLYLLIMAQRRCGNTGKAVKNAELLVSKDPENKWFQMALAYSYKERGYTQKAFRACETAYGLGCRETDFLLLYASFCDDNRLYKQGIEVLSGLIRQEIRWTRDDIPNLIEAYGGLISMNYYGNADVLVEILDHLQRFLEQYSIYAKEYIPRIALLIANACMHVKYSTPEYEAICRFFESAQKICRQENNQLQSAIELFHYQRVLADPRIEDTLVSYLELFHDFPPEDDDEAPDEMLEKFSMADLQLCMIMQRDETLAQSEILKQEHPQEYAKIADFMAKLEDKSRLHLLKERLLKTYQRLQPFFYDGMFYERYPAEKAKAAGRVMNEGSENEPYVRQTKKVGRNDPCPCGSGKKYKHCCMNKTES